MTQGFQRQSVAESRDLDSEAIDEIRDRLTEATIKCSERCLYQSAKWAAELLNSLPEPDEQDEDDDHDSHMYNADAPTSSYRVFSTSYDDPTEAALEAKEAPRYLLAKSFFDTKEYDRCAAVFLPPAIPAGRLAGFEGGKGRTPTSTPSKMKQKAKQPEKLVVNPFPKLSQKSLFLALYARYIAGEKRRDEETEMVLGPADGGQTANRELPALARGLDLYFEEAQARPKQSQGWLEFLYGVILARSSQESAAQEWLLRAVSLNPYHWGAWEELGSLLATIDDLTAQISPAVPPTIMTLIYQTHAAVDLFSATDPATTFANLSSLLAIFPRSTFLQTQLALAHNHAKDFEASASVFQSLLTTHPHRLDALDHYSNILYVMNDRPRLAFLAHLATAVDKFRPETCCVVGNYYSLCSQHEKAVMYFRRALTLDRKFLSAWTLMGHEYIELKNTHAAIESYRRAVDVNRKDYRAWYGLGQAYEVLDMGFYALFYYQRAAGLRPYDAKMWQAVGSCYAKMDRLESAVKSLKRALVAGTYFETESADPSFNLSVTSGRGDGSQEPKRATGRKLLDPETLFQIAGLYERMGNEEEAGRYMEVCLNQETGVGGGEVARWEKAKRRRTRREVEAAAADGEDVEDGDTEILSSSDNESLDDPTRRPPHQPDGAHDDERAVDGGPDGFGTGTTATTSKARLWLARYAWKKGDLETAERLAEELCMDGFEVEEAKGLVREIRAKKEETAGFAEMGMG